MMDDAAIGRIAQGVLERTLPKAEWTHRAHWALALWLLRHQPEQATPEAMRAVISGYNLATGTANTDTGGYHHTITIASMRAAEAALAQAGESAGLAQVLAGLVDSPLGRPEWLLEHWHKDTLFDVAARQGWVEPDRVPLPY